MRSGLTYVLLWLVSCSGPRPGEERRYFQQLDEQRHEAQQRYRAVQDPIPIGFLESTFEAAGGGGPFSEQQRSIAASFRDLPDASVGQRMGKVLLDWHPEQGCSDPRLVRNNGDTIPFAHRDLYVNLHARVAYYARANGFVKLASHTVPYGVWVNEREFSQHAFPRSFMDFVTSYALWNVTGYDGRSLRSAPADDAASMIQLNERFHKIRAFTGARNGPWAEVVIAEVVGNDVTIDCYTVDELESVCTGNRWTGWIRVLNDDGSMGPLQILPIC
jgi:hypothetical protein